MRDRCDEWRVRDLYRIQWILDLVLHIHTLVAVVKWDWVTHHTSNNFIISDLSSTHYHWFALLRGDWIYRLSLLYYVKGSARNLFSWSNGLLLISHRRRIGWNFIWKKELSAEDYAIRIIHNKWLQRLSRLSRDLLRQVRTRDVRVTLLRCNLQPTKIHHQFQHFCAQWRWVVMNELALIE